MRRVLGVLIAMVVAGLGVGAWYLYGGRATPPGQPPLVRLNAGNFTELIDDFNAAASQVRVVVMLSPT